MHKMVGAIGLAIALFGASAVQAQAVVLECTASGEPFWHGNSAVFRTGPTQRVRIDGRDVSVWDMRSGGWRRHPCMIEFKDGQFCTTTANAVEMKESRVSVPGELSYETELTIDRVSGRITYNAVRVTPTMAPYIRERRASGACVEIDEPS